MLELRAVRIHAAGPPGEPFERALIRLSADGATLVVGNNGSGKTTLVRLVRLVFGNIPHVQLVAMVAADRVGHVCTEWLDADSDKRVLLGVAVKRKGDMVDVRRYALELGADADVEELVNVDEATFAGLIRRHAQTAGQYTWTDSLGDWLGLLARYELGGESIVGFPGDDEDGMSFGPGGRWLEGSADFVKAVVEYCVPAHQREAVASTDAVSRCLDLLRAFEAQSRVYIDGVGEKPLVEINFKEHSRQQIERVIRNAKAPGMPALPISGQPSLDETVIQVTGRSLVVRIFDLGSRRYHDIRDFKTRASGASRRFVISLLSLLLARHSASGPVRAVVMDSSPSPGGFGKEFTVMQSWGLSSIWLSTPSANIPSHRMDYVYSLTQQLNTNGELCTTIDPAIWLRDRLTPDSQGSDEGSIAVGEMFELLCDPTDVSVGDIGMAGLRVTGTTGNAGLIDEARLLDHVTDSRLIIRPREALDSGELMYYIRYLGSDRLLGDDIRAGMLAVIQPNDLVNLRIPQPDRETVRAIKDLADATTTFAAWRDDAYRAIDSFFEQNDLFAAKAEIVTAGRLTRQRREAAHVLDELGSRVRSVMPFPIARRWRDVEAAQSDQPGYSQILSCAETVVTFCASVGISAALTQAAPVPGINILRRTLDRGNPLTFGLWSRMLDDLAQYAASMTLPPTSPLRQFEAFQGDAVSVIRRLKERRNDVAHQRVPGPHEIGAHFNDAHSDVEYLLDRAYWLADYPLRIVELERWDSLVDLAAVSYRELVGDHSVVALKSDTSHQRLEVDSPYLADPYGHYWLLRPLLHSTNCQDCGQLTLFVLERWNTAKCVAQYRALDHGHTIEVQAASSLRAVRLIS